MSNIIGTDLKKLQLLLKSFGMVQSTDTEGDVFYVDNHDGVSDVVVGGEFTFTFDSSGKFIRTGDWV